MQIDNGAGGSRASMGVDLLGRGLAYVTDRPEARQYNMQLQAFVLPIFVTPGGAGNVFAFIGNSRTDNRIIVVDMINLLAASAETVDIYVGPNSSITVTGSTSPSLVSKNQGRYIMPSSTANFGVGTGISGGSSSLTQLDSIGLGTAGLSVTYRLDSGIILPTNQAIALKAITGSIALRGSIHGYLMDGTTVGAWVE